MQDSDRHFCAVVRHAMHHIYFLVLICFGKFQNLHLKLCMLIKLSRAGNVHDSKSMS